jgi:ABC-type Na+ efflux pump permease subunit
LKSNFEQSREELRRSQARTKRRKTNIILNSLIGLVILLIIIVSVSIFSGNDEKKSQPKEQKIEKSTAGSESKQIVKKDSETAKSASGKADKAKETKKADGDKKKADKEKDAEDSVTVQEGGGPNVKRTITNPAWEPVESSQAAPYSSESTDWNERVKALSQAIGVDEGNMTVWYMGRSGENPNQSVGTVTAKGDPQQAYRVYLEWQDGAGWMPVKVEELVENDKN